MLNALQNTNRVMDNLSSADELAMENCQQLTILNSCITFGFVGCLQIDGPDFAEYEFDIDTNIGEDYFYFGGSDYPTLAKAFEAGILSTVEIYGRSLSDFPRPQIDFSRHRAIAHSCALSGGVFDEVEKSWGIILPEFSRHCLLISKLESTSWHNDACASFSVTDEDTNNYVRLWIGSEESCGTFEPMQLLLETGNHDADSGEHTNHYLGCDIRKACEMASALVDELEARKIPTAEQALADCRKTLKAISIDSESIRRSIDLADRVLDK